MYVNQSSNVQQDIVQVFMTILALRFPLPMGLAGCSSQGDDTQTELEVC